VGPIPMHEKEFNEEKYFMRKERKRYEEMAEKPAARERYFVIKETGYVKCLEKIENNRNLLKVFFGYIYELKINKDEIISILARQIYEEEQNCYAMIKRIMEERITCSSEIYSALER
jgi:hypothetical protein